MLCKNYFHGYARSKDIMWTIMDLIEQATTPQRPWTIKAVGNNYTANNRPYFVVSHTFASGETHDFLFHDQWNVTSPANNIYGNWRVDLFPDSTFNPVTHALPFPLKFQGFGAFHGTQAADVDDLPQFVWYWLYVDDDVLMLVMMGNQGAAGSASSLVCHFFIGNQVIRDLTNQSPNLLSEWAYHPPKGGSMVWTSSGTLAYRSVEYYPYADRVLGLGRQSRWNASIGVATWFIDQPTNLLPASIVPPMDSDFTPYGFRCFTDSLYYLTTQPPYFAFDTHNGTYWRTDAAAGSAFIGMEFGTATRVTSYAMTTYYSQAIWGWEFQGSQDGQVWVTLDTQVDQFKELATAVVTPIKTYFFDNPTAYKYYRWLITAKRTTAVYIYSLALGTVDKPALATRLVTRPTFSESYTRDGRAYTYYPSIFGEGQFLTGHALSMARADILVVEGERADYVFHSFSPASHNFFMKRMESCYDLSISNALATSCRITWTNPSKLAGVKLLRKVVASGGMPYSYSMVVVSDGTVVFEDIDATPSAVVVFDDTALTAGETYEYMAVGYDSNGNHSVPVLAAKARVTLPV